MKEKYFDPWEFKHAIDFINTRPSEANKKFEEYLKQYPNDYSCYPFYVTSLINLGNFNKAWQIIHNLEKNYVKDAQFSTQPSKVKMVKENIMYCKLKIFIFTEKYKEAYNLYKNNKKTLDDLNLQHVFFFCRSKVDKENIKPEEIDCYSYRQMLTYTEEDFKDHIKKHTADYNQHFDEPNKLIFNPDFPLDAIIEETKKYIPSAKKTHPGFYEDIYIFKYDQCG